MGRNPDRRRARQLAADTRHSIDRGAPTPPANGRGQQ
jgi:hypothetical protein